MSFSGPGGGSGSSSGSDTTNPLTGPAEDVVYFVVERYIAGEAVYMVEAMASRYIGGNAAQATPGNPEYAFCVDCGVQIAPTKPAADLTITMQTSGVISGAEIVSPGDSYTAPTVSVVDLVGSGSGAQVSLTVTNGQISAVSINVAGQGYASPALEIEDATGTGAIIALSTSDTCLIAASQPVFQSGMVGNILRASGGEATVVTYQTTESIVASVSKHFTQFIPNTNQPAVAFSGTWSIGPTFTQVVGLDHLEGAQVVGLADGQPVGPLTVTEGAVTLPQAASIATIGLGYVAQLQTLRLEVPENGGTIQGKRKQISAVTIRAQDTTGIYVGPSWTRMAPMNPPGYAAAGSTFETGGGVLSEPASTGLYGQDPVRYADMRQQLGPGWSPDGQICIMQPNPLPMTILGVIPEFSVGDS